MLVEPPPVVPGVAPVPVEEPVELPVEPPAGPPVVAAPGCDVATKGFAGTWPDFVCTSQRNWIGRSEGLELTFALEGARLPKKLEKLVIFTTRHDTIFGASFMAISPEHPLAQHLAKKNKELAAFIEDCRKIGTTEEALARA